MPFMREDDPRRAPNLLQRKDDGLREDGFPTECHVAGEVNADLIRTLRTFEVNPKRIRPIYPCMFIQECSEWLCYTIGFANHEEIHGIILPDCGDRFSID